MVEIPDRELMGDENHTEEGHGQTTYKLSVNLRRTNYDQICCSFYENVNKLYIFPNMVTKSAQQHSCTTCCNGDKEKQLIGCWVCFTFSQDSTIWIFLGIISETKSDT